jgi:hypothetical protein
MSFVGKKTDSPRKVANRCYVALNAAIHKVIDELHKLDTKMPSPIEFV